MRVVIVTGIYPPDIGGPATHASDLRDALIERGHRVVVLTLGDAAGVRREPGLVRWPRSWSWPRRHAAVVRWIVANRDRIDAIYATGMHPAAVAGARLARLPSVVKIVADPVWERARRKELTHAEFEAFRASPGPGRTLAMMRLVRNASLRGASRIVVPATALSRDVEAWLGGPVDITVIPNGVAVPEHPTLDPRGRSSSGELSLVFVGRLVDVKRVDRIVRAVAMTDDVRLTIIGSGPEAVVIERAIASAPSAKITLEPALPHDLVLQRIAAADALVLASDTEGLPHVVLEALAMGTPVVAPSVGGIPEVVRNECEGLLLDDASEEDLATAFRRLRDEPGLLERLGTGAVEAGRSWRFGATADAVLAVMEAAARKRPHIVLVGKARFVRGDRELEARVRLMQRRSDITLVQTGGEGQAGVQWVGATRAVVFPAFSPKAVASLFFYSVGPVVAVAASLRKHGPNVVMPQSPFEAVMAIVASRAVPPRARPKVVVQVHGDWRTATHLYGSSSRRWVAPIANALAAWAIRHADRVRTIGSYTESLVRETGYDGPSRCIPDLPGLHSIPRSTVGGGSVSASRDVSRRLGPCEGPRCPASCLEHGGA